MKIKINNVIRSNCTKYCVFFGRNTVLVKKSHKLDCFNFGVKVGDYLQVYSWRFDCSFFYFSKKLKFVLQLPLNKHGFVKTCEINRLSVDIFISYIVCNKNFLKFSLTVYNLLNVIHVYFFVFIKSDSTLKICMTGCGVVLQSHRGPCFETRRGVNTKGRLLLQKIRNNTLQRNIILNETKYSRWKEMLI